MTEFEVVEYQEVNNRNFSMINDICDKETKDNSFSSNSFISAKDVVDLIEKKKNSISYINHKNLQIFDRKINENSSKRFSEKLEKIPENFANIIEKAKYGPNVNIKQPKKTYNSKEEREFFKNLIVHKQKTELCKNWVLYNDCYFKETCSFAHGEKDLRITFTPLNYKTKICKAFAEKYFCSYGNRCHYSHSVRYYLS